MCRIYLLKLVLGNSVRKTFVDSAVKCSGGEMNSDKTFLD